MNRPEVVRRTVVVALGLGLLVLAWIRLAERLGSERAERSIRPVLMGTTSRLVAVGRRDALEPGLAAALGAIDEVVARMSLYDPESELSRWNRSPTGAGASLDRSTLEVLAFGLDLSQATGGAFDVTVGPLLALWREAAGRGAPPTDAQIAAALERVGSTKVELVGGEAIKAVPGLIVTLDAIAKGYAVDRAIEALEAAGVEGGLVEIGGDLRTFGRPLREALWTIGIQSPWGEGVLATVAIGEGALCTSGHYRRFVTIGDRSYSHLVDPRTGRPVDHQHAATVFAPDAMTADGWATALTVLSAAEGRARLEAVDRIGALLVSGSPSEPDLAPSEGFPAFDR